MCLILHPKTENLNLKTRVIDNFYFIQFTFDNRTISCLVSPKLQSVSAKIMDEVEMKHCHPFDGLERLGVNEVNILCSTKLLISFALISRPCVIQLTILKTIMNFIGSLKLPCITS